MFTPRMIIPIDVPLHFLDGWRSGHQARIVEGGVGQVVLKLLGCVVL